MDSKRTLGLFGFLLVGQMTVSAVNLQVDQMNALLKFPGWPKIVDEGVGVDGKRFTVNDLLAKSPNGQVVTAENVDNKIRQAYTLLSCIYARTISKYNGCVINFGLQCARFDDPLEARGCMEWWFQNTDQFSIRLVVAMNSALYFFQRLSPQTIDTTELNCILCYLECYYKSKSFDESTYRDANNEIDLANIHRDCGAVQSDLSAIDSVLHLIIETNCWPKENHSKNQTNWANKHLNEPIPDFGNTPPQEAIIALNNYIKDIFFITMIGNYSYFGFRYDRPTQTSVVKTMRL